MHIIHAYWWLWLILSIASFAAAPRLKRSRPLGELTLGVAGILLILSLVSHMLPTL